MKQSFFLVFIIVLLNSCQSDMGTFDGIELGKGLETQLKNIVAINSSDQIIDQVNQYIREPISDLSSIKLYKAEAELSEDEIKPVKIVLVKLAELLSADAYLALMINESEVLRVRIWGVEDKFAAFENFYRQFDIKIPIQSEILSDSTIDNMVNELSDTTKFLFDHSRRMYNKNFLIRHTFAMASDGKTPPAEWYRQQQNEFQLLAFQIDQIESLIGKEAIMEYKKIANKTVEDLNPVIEQLETAPDADDLKERILLIRNENRRSCHNIKIKNSENGLKRYLELIMPDNGHRKDLFQVDVDIWAMPGKNELSQQLANIVRSITIYMSLMN